MVNQILNLQGEQVEVVIQSIILGEVEEGAVQILDRREAVVEAEVQNLD